MAGGTGGHVIPAISIAELRSIGTFKIWALRSTIVDNNSVL